MKVRPSPSHHEFRDDLIAVLRKHGDNLTALEMLALASHLVGQLVALQDQRTLTPDRVMEIVAKNIELGNQEIIEGLTAAKGLMS